MSLRKAHTKSRFGCLPCKKRHIKCGEEVPLCQNCVFRKVICEYGIAARASPGILARAASLDDARSTVSPPRGGLQQFSTTPRTREPIPSPGIRVPRQQELQLMICFMNKTSQTLAHGDEDLVIWREAVPDEAVNCDFLMDGLLAMAALHFAYENPDSRLQYTELAMRYQNSSLQVYNKALDNINEENCTALFAFSIIVNIMALA
ncbi:C6 transcription factor [Pyrenophora tritici-repentis]|uniref:C6 transcription factor n=1 Tax=Pyrenophora tritici-repentis TaxID=45151 RepID=A0A2W1CWJ2_9PLEO|nr:C6 zinc finger domain protein [Pyrenophora tritici-repentis]KAF7454835.1 C6 zinc finger domain protein [Pyrenophora tritici-repentis]KAF7577982.1 C6 transcription factor [Pyrenophora tritici-repentis]KAG9388597.1 C6 zinc finger domain protein [Pyrenophora tritici-repentis]KAI0571269.1 C6 zinc finger domain protein [Pyrenophora tritici-repentis]